MLKCFKFLVFPINGSYYRCYSITLIIYLKKKVTYSADALCLGI